MKELKTVLLGEEGKVGFEERVFNATMLLAIALTIIGIIANLLYHSPILIDCFFLVCWLLVYIFNRKIYWVKPIAYLILVYLLVPYNWFHSSGIQGPVPYYSIVFVAVISITTRGTWRRVLFYSLLGIQSLLIYYDTIRFDYIPFESIISISVQLNGLIIATAFLMFNYSNDYLNEKIRNKMYSDAIEKQNVQQLYCLEHLELINTKLRSDRHDFNNHLSIIYGLLIEKEFDQSLKYTVQQIEISKSYHSIIDIPYPKVRAMINFKLNIMKESGIKLDCKFNLPKNLNLNQLEFGILLGNLLDNAMEAQLTVETRKKYLKFEMYYEPDYLIVKMENPYTHLLKNSSGQFKSTKENSQDHGYGLKNVRNIIEENEGIFKAYTDSGKFIVDIALLLL